MKIARWGFIAFFFCVTAFAENTIEYPFPKIHTQSSDEASLQRGAELYMNYCAGCHSLRYMRYSQLGKGIGITEDNGNLAEDLLKNNLIFTGAKVGDLILTAMSEKDAANWFGIAPPDLTLSARVHSKEWLYTFLRTFYRDDSRPWGSNNWLFPDVAMPNVLRNLQGEQVAIYRTEQVAHEGNGKPLQVVDHLQLMNDGEIDEQAFDAAILDLVNFLVFTSEPIRAERVHLGTWVLLFLVVFTIFAYLLKREFWSHIS
ncbi:MAG: cytochrome c1 [Proteobacteria bacterium]|nr:cytochrome c1 [Pseudomonadota bacterium]